MAQFRIYRNVSDSAGRGVLFLLDVQTNLLTGLATRLVVPLYRRTAYPGQLMAGLMPVFEIGSELCVAAVAEMAAVPAKSLGSEVADVGARRHDILSALDLLISGF